MYFDDMEPGFVFRSDPITLTEEQIVAFAREYDPQPFHVDKAAAEKTMYGGLIASGVQTLGVSLRQVLDLKLFEASSLGSPGMEYMRWIKPVRPGDSLTTTGTVEEVKPSRSKPQMGAVKILYEVTNQDGILVSSYLSTHLLARNPNAN